MVDICLYFRKDRLPLHVACTRDNGNIVKELIRRNALDKGSRDCLAAVDAFSRTPLQIACLNNNVNVVKYLTDGVKELLPMLDMEVFVNYSTGEHGEFLFVYLCCVKITHFSSNCR